MVWSQDLIIKIINASKARACLCRLIDQAAISHRPLMISGRRANVVLVSEEDWRAIQETLYLLNSPGMGESIKDGMAKPLLVNKKSLKI